MGPSRGGAPWRLASGRQRRLSLTACGNTVSPQIMQSAWMTAGRVFWRMGPYFLATAATARMMRAMPRSSQKPKVRRKMRKEKRMEDSGSMAEIMLASVGRI